MRLKLYRSNDVETAVKAAGQELGEDAMLVSVERSQPHEASFGRYRVVFANGLPSLQPEIPKTAPIRDRMPKWGELRSSLGMLVDQLSSPVRVSSNAVLRQFLLDSGFAATDLPAIQGAFESSSINELLSQSIVPQTSGLAGISAFVGPAGAGKSTAVDKLALRESKAGKRVLILRAFQANSHRPPHPDPSVLEVSVMTVREFDVIRHIHPAPELILIDTSSQLSPGQASQFSNWLKTMDAEVQLVLNAVTRLKEWQNYGSKFSEFHATRLLPTHMDEVVSWAALWSTVVSSRMECSFFSSGPLLTDPIDCAGPNPFRNEFLDLGEKIKQFDTTRQAAKSAAAAV